MLSIRTAWDRPSRPPDGVTEHVLLIGITPQTGLANLPGNFCILLDCSGSMEGKMLEDAKAACRLACQCLNQDDLLSLITFNTRPAVRFAAQQCQALTDAASEEHQQPVKAEGTTRVEAALSEADKALAQNAGSGRTSAVLLITDGHPTDRKGEVLKEYDSFYTTADELARHRPRQRRSWRCEELQQRVPDDTLRQRQGTLLLRSRVERAQFCSQ